MIYFKSPVFFNMLSLKEEYNTLAKENIDDDAALVIINAEYCYVLARRKWSVEQQVAEALAFAITLDHVTVELIGNWVWVSGETWTHAKVLKTNGFKFAPKKKMWTYAGVKTAGRGASMFAIRFKYGSRTIKETA